MNWVVYALLAAALWGASYTMYGQILKQISSPTLAVCAALGSVTIFSVVALLRDDFARDIVTLKASPATVAMMLAVVVVNASAVMLMYSSIKASNATLAGLLEISYPLFTALFTYLILRENTINVGTAAGAALIFAGILCIYHFNRTA